MATQSPFSFVSDALAQFATHTQPPQWVLDETIHRLVLFINHVLGSEPEAQSRLARQKGRIIQLQWKDKIIQLAPTPAGLMERVADQKFDLKLTLTDASPLDMASAVLKGNKPQVHVEGDVQLAAEVNWLIDHVRWDIEEDLSTLLGDAAAHTLVECGRQAVVAVQQFVAKMKQTGPFAPLEKDAA
jgi:ubiquinone biosynthesis accessory factor UbiJ